MKPCLKLKVGGGRPQQQQQQQTEQMFDLYAGRLAARQRFYQSQSLRKLLQQLRRTEVELLRLKLESIKCAEKGSASLAAGCC